MSQVANKLKGLPAVVRMLFWENGIDNPMHGYKVTKMLKELDVRYSHQQVYREVNKKLVPNGIVEVIMEPQEGKPDRKTWKWQGDNGKVSITDILDPNQMKVEDVVAFSCPELVKAKMDCVIKELEAAMRSEASLSMPQGRNAANYKVKLLQMQCDYLTNKLRDLQSKQAKAA